MIKKYIGSKKQNLWINLFLACAVYLLMSSGFAYKFSIAWWPPLTLNATSQNFSLFLFLTGSLFLLYGNKFWGNFFLLFSLSATLVHFAMGIFMIVFCLIALWDELKPLFIGKIFLTSVIIPVVILIIFFTPEVSISVQDFIHIYIGRHSKHYIISELGSLTPYSWWYSLLLVVILILSAFIIGWRFQNRKLKLLSLLFLASYTGCLLLQYAGIEIVPNKFIAALGPIRYSFLGLWMIILLSAHSILISYEHIATFIYKFNFLNNTGKYFNYLHSLVENSRIVNVFSFVIISIVLVGVNYSVNKNDPFADIRFQNKDFYNWIESETEKDAVFAVTMTSNLAFQIPLVAKRAIFIGNGFPFNEKFFKEYYERYTLLYGAYDLKNPTDKDIYQRSDFYYDQLKPEDYSRISKIFPLHYVIFEKDKKFEEIKPAFEGKNLIVYKLKDFNR